MRLFDTAHPRAGMARALFATLLTSALLIFPAAGPHATQAAGTIVATQDISNTTAQSESPQISAGGGRVSAQWVERGSSTTGALGFSSTTVDANFPGATIQNVGSNAQYQWSDVVVDSTGTSHVVYPSGSGVFYQRRPASGGRSTVTIATGFTLPNAAKIARGPNGRLWALWRNGDGSELRYKFSDTNGDSWVNGSDGGVIPNGSGRALGIDIVVDLSNVAHVFWHNNNGTNKFQIRYADWNGSSFATSELTTDSFIDADPVATVDPSNTLHVFWRKQISSGTNEVWSIYHASRPIGGSFGNFEGIVSPGKVAYAPAASSDAAGNLYVTFPVSQGSNGAHIMIMNKLVGKGWDGPLDLKVAGRRFDSRNAVAGTSETGAEAHVLIQSELGTDDGEIFYKRVKFADASVPGAQPVIEGGANTTKNNPVSVAFTGVVNSPTQVRWRWNAAPTDTANDSNGWQTFTNPKSIALPTGVTACTPLTLYTQVKNDVATEAAAKTDTIQFDNTVQANVTVSNPHLAGLPQTFASVADNSTTNATDGDPGYTRDSTAWLTIADAGDCSGLANFEVTTGNPPNPVFTNGVFQGKISLPQTNIANPGSTADISVAVVDSISNLRTFSNSIIYDPADTDPSTTVSNTAGLPVVNGGSVSADSGTSIIRTLSFSNVNVNDNIYGQKEGLPSGHRFWGVWIANATSDVGASSTSLQWFPVKVANPNSSFTIRWSLFTGFNPPIGPDRTKPGTYFVYVRFLDGAGNPSAPETALRTTVTLPAGYTIPTTLLPFVKK